MIILVTGSQGFIGRNLVEELDIDGHEVLCWDSHGRNPLGQPAFKNFKDIRHALFGVLKDLKKEKDKNLNIVFSPCSASFDQFENFEKRGEFFNKMLKKTNFIKKGSCLL